MCRVRNRLQLAAVSERNGILLIVSLSFLAGCLSALRLTGGLWLWGLAGLSLLMGWLLRRLGAGAGIALAFCFFALGALRFQSAYFTPQPDPGTYEITGYVYSERPDQRVAFVLGDVALDGAPASGRAYCTLHYDDVPPVLFDGAQVRFEGRVYLPDGKSGEPHMDFALWMRQSGQSFGIAAYQGIAVLNGEADAPVRDAAYRVRQSFIRALERVMGEEARVAVALLLDFRVKDRSESLRDILEAVSAWTLESRDDLQSHANHIASVSAPVRVTFLSEAGTVIADSEHDAASMENHLDRPEVAAALQGGVGESLRLSDTQLAFMMYAAKRIAPGVILRLGYPVEIISHTLLFYSIGVVALAIILYILQRRRLTRFAVAMVRQMDDVRRLLEGATTDPTAVFPELQPALEHIAYLAKRLNSDLAEINRTLSLRDDFVANASHELRSPLTSIMGFAEMLGEGLADTPEEQALCLQTIRGECERMLDVVEDVLLLSRAEREQGLTREHVDVERVVEEVRRALAPQAAQKRISIVSEGALTLWAVEKDLWEILHNLMGNAIRYGRRGGHVKILLRQRCIIVEDDGIGIEKKHLPYLFEQFYRVDQSRDPEVRGTGLGLSIVRTLAERNGATVGVESCPGRGSRFTVCFEQKQDGD